MPHTNISLSAVRSFQRCEQQFEYRYVQRLQRRERAKQLELGTILHRYLELYDKALVDEMSAEDAHVQAQLAISNEFTDRLKKLSNVAFMAGNEELAKDLLELGPKAGRLTQHYFESRGRSDAEEYEPILIEMSLDTIITSQLRSRGRVDKVTRSQATGRVSLWENKSAKSVPNAGVRLRDLQTVLYAEQLRRFYNLDVDSVTWNYLRTKEPTEPELLKSSKVPALTKAKNIDSTWEVYSLAAKRLGVDIDTDEYDAVRQRLSGRAQKVFFPRYEVAIMTDSTVMLRDYARTGLEIRRQVARWSEGKVKPVRNLDQHCDFCDFNMLCRAVITGGDTEELVAMRYETKPARAARQ